MFKIKVLSKKEVVTINGKKKEFFRYFSPCNIEVVENGQSQGVQLRNLRVHFTKNASKKLNDEKVFAIFTCEKSEDYQLPQKFEVIDYSTATDDEKGKNDIWIRDFVEMKEIPFKPRESTCQPVLDDELETEETSID